MINNIIRSLLHPILHIIDKNILDKDLAEKIKATLTTQGFDLMRKELQAQKSVLNTEVSGDSWLQKNWRPILMLVFTVLMVAYWLGFAGKNLSEETIANLLSIIKIGISGYVIGRSAEKIMRTFKE